MNPVGPLPERVYWIRRAVVIGIAVVLLVGLVWFALAKVRGNSDPTNAGAPSTPSSSSSAGLTGVLASPTSESSMEFTTPDPDTTPATSTVSDSSVSSAAASVSDTVAASESGSPAAPPPPVRTTTPAPASVKTPAATPTAPKTPAPTPTAPKTTAPTTTAPKPAGSGSSTAPQTAATPPSTPGTPKSTVATTPASTSAPKPPASSTPKPTPTPTPTTDAQGRLLCTDAAISLTSTVGQATYRVGAGPILGLNVRNVSNSACVRDVSGTLQVFTVYNAQGKRMWSTADCFPGEGTDIRQLATGQDLQYNIKWSGTTSQPECAGTRVPVPAGTYTVVAQLGSLKAAPAKVTFVG